MTRIRKIGNGDYYLTRVNKDNGRRGTNSISTTRNWWFGAIQIKLGTVCVPKELQGKKIMFKIEILGDEDV